MIIFFVERGLSMYITKSDYLLYKQCPKSFWLHKNRPEVFDISDNKSRLDKGNEVTEVSRNLFPNGDLVPYSSNIIEMIERTKELISKGVKTIYEAAFEFNGLVVICDILRFGKDGWEIYEVKSSTGIKERYLDDISFQYFVVNNCVTVSSISLIYLNNKYIRYGKLNYKDLFSVVDKTNEAKKNIVPVKFSVSAMKQLLDDEEVTCDIGLYCNKYGKDDFPCGAKGLCWSHIPEYSIFDITRIGKKAFDMYNKDIVSLKDIPTGYKLSDSQKFQVDAFKEDIEIINKKEIQTFLSLFRFPLYFLDFETFQQAIPKFNELKPYQQIPFQYSLHILLSSDGELSHKEFLGKEGIDPRRSLAESLINDIPKGSCSVAYNMSFEKMVLRDLSELYPDLSHHLMDIHDNMIDLMIPFQKKWYYTNDMRGSYSIKYVLPALLPNNAELDYKKLNIQNGSMAMEIYERLHTYSEAEILSIRKDLLAYCHLDTLAMVKLWEKLKEI